MPTHRVRTICPRASLPALLVAAFGLVTVQPTNAQSCASGTPPSILTAQYGNLRQGYNASESMLTSTCINGYVFIPTKGISSVASNSHATCSATTPCSGVLVYSGH